MNVIWKYPLDEPDVEGLPPAPRARFYVEMPAGARVLSVGEQPELGIVLWALVNTEAPNVRRQIDVYATGPEVDVAGAVFVDTVQVGPLVWHVFDAGEADE